LCQDYSRFIEAGAEILAIGPDGPNAFKGYWENEHMPFPGLSDIGNKIAKLYYQEMNLLKFGWVPAMFIVDLAGKIRYAHYGDNMQDIPKNQDILAILEEIRKENV